MTNTLRNTQLLRRLGTAAVIAALALTSGCFTSEGGRVGEMVQQRIGVDQTSPLDQLGVVVDQQGATLVFDFSNVAEPGTLSTLDAGHQVPSNVVGTVWGAMVDADFSDADPSAVVLQLDRHGLLVSFDGLTYDQNTIVKIDLRLSQAS